MREPRNDKRKEPTKEPNTHYWANMIFKHIKFISAFIILLTCILMLYLGELAENQFEVIKGLACMSAGFLFGSGTSK